MLTPKKPDWEISMRQAGSVVLAVPLALGVALIVWKVSFWRLVSPILGRIFFVVAAIVLAVVFYSILEWYWNRPGQLAKRIPISSKEVRRRTRRFYDSLPKG